MASSKYLQTSTSVSNPLPRIDGAAEQLSVRLLALSNVVSTLPLYLSSCLPTGHAGWFLASVTSHIDWQKLATPLSNVAATYSRARRNGLRSQSASLMPAGLPLAYVTSRVDGQKLATPLTEICCNMFKKASRSQSASLVHAGALDEVDWLRNKLERLETSISAMARTAGSVGPEGGPDGGGPQAASQLGQQPKEYRYEK